MPAEPTVEEIEEFVEAELDRFRDSQRTDALRELFSDTNYRQCIVEVAIGLPPTTEGFPDMTRAVQGFILACDAFTRLKKASSRQTRRAAERELRKLKARYSIPFELGVD